MPNTFRTLGKLQGAAANHLFPITKGRYLWCIEKRTGVDFYVANRPRLVAHKVVVSRSTWQDFQRKMRPGCCPECGTPIIEGR